MHGLLFLRQTVNVLHQLFVTPAAGTGFHTGERPHRDVLALQPQAGAPAGGHRRPPRHGPRHHGGTGAAAALLHPRLGRQRVADVVCVETGRRVSNREVVCHPEKASVFAAGKLHQHLGLCLHITKSDPNSVLIQPPVMFMADPDV